MGLLKDKELETGVVINYWKIINTEISFHNKRCKVYLAGFLNKEARDEGKNHMDVVQFNFDGMDFPLTLDGNNIQEMYSKITEPKPKTETQTIDGGEVEVVVETNLFANLNEI